MELHTDVNFDKYVKRMSRTKNKDLLMSYIPDGATVLDFGCGSGEMSKNFSPESYVGYDLSVQMIDEASSRHPGYVFVSELGDRTFDVVMFSSVLHEIYSYNNYSYRAVVDVLREVRQYLNDGGVILIRDGIMGVENGVTEYALRNTDDATAFLEVLNKDNPLPHNVFISDGKLVGKHRDVVAFLNVYTWGWDSLPREKFERVNFATNLDYNVMIHQGGYEIAAFDTISQEDYFKHLGKLVDLNGDTWLTKAFIIAR